MDFMVVIPVVCNAMQNDTEAHEEVRDDGLQPILSEVELLAAGPDGAAATHLLL